MLRRVIAPITTLLTAAWALAGPLQPPIGAISATGKPLIEVEPRTPVNASTAPGDSTCTYRITQPGSYYLTENLQGVAGKAGVAIACSGVTLDLNGFELFGVAGVGGSLDAIATTAADLSNISISNGSIRNWGGDGVDLFSFLAFSCRIERVRASNNAGAGINAGTGTLVQGCSASNNLGNGVSVAAGSVVSDCAAYGNGVNGFNLGAASCVRGCTSYFNVQAGINTANGCTVSDNNCRINSGDGIKSTAACLISGNTLTANGLGSTIGAGVHVTGADNRIDGNLCQGADTGVDVDTTGNLVVRNSCTGNTANWAIASGNAVGPIVTAGTTSSAINGSGTAASTLGTTDPFANFNY